MAAGGRGGEGEGEKAEGTGTVMGQLCALHGGGQLVVEGATLPPSLHQSPWSGLYLLRGASGSHYHKGL